MRSLLKAHHDLRGFDNYAHAVRVDGLTDGQGDLLRQSLLDLKTATEDFHNPKRETRRSKSGKIEKKKVWWAKPGQLGEAENFAVGQVTDGHFADEGDQVVLAHGEHFDILDKDHLVVILVENGAIQYL